MQKLIKLEYKNKSIPIREQTYFLSIDYYSKIKNNMLLLFKYLLIKNYDI